MNQRIAIVSDLDGCLLNKEDYSFAPAVPLLQAIRDLNLPVILASSKTVSEMRLLAEEMELADAPIICENGGAVYWSREDSTPGQILGASRKQILENLQKLKGEFHFESFEDLGLSGVIASTDLPEGRARLAMQRASTEPLLWRDSDVKLDFFARQLADEGLTFTRGGRFWHVAGQTSKGNAMQYVMSYLQTKNPGNWTSIAIGDSPIDQSMLDIADYPIGIPSPNGVVHVEVKAHNGLVADSAGAQGWADSVTAVLQKLGANL